MMHQLPNNGPALSQQQHVTSPQMIPCNMKMNMGGNYFYQAPLQSAGLSPAMQIMGQQLGGVYGHTSNTISVQPQLTLARVNGPIQPLNQTQQSQQTAQGTGKMDPANVTLHNSNNISQNNTQQQVRQQTAPHLIYNQRQHPSQSAKPTQGQYQQAPFSSINSVTMSVTPVLSHDQSPTHQSILYHSLPPPSHNGGLEPQLIQTPTHISHQPNIQNTQHLQQHIKHPPHAQQRQINISTQHPRSPTNLSHQQINLPEVTINQLQQILSTQGILAAYHFMLSCITTSHISEEVVTSNSLSVTFENQFKTYIENGQPITQIKVLVSEYLKLEEKKHKKRAANRKSASISRSRKKKFIERLTIENNKLKRLNRLLTVLPDLTFSLSSDGEITYVNWRAQKMLDYPYDLVGQNFAKFISSEKVSLINTALKSLHTTANTILPRNKEASLNGNTRNLYIQKPVGGNYGDHSSVNTEETIVVDGSTLNTAKNDIKYSVSDDMYVNKMSNVNGNDFDTVDGMGNDEIKLANIGAKKAKELAEIYDKEMANIVVNLIKSDGKPIPCYMRLSVILPKSVCQSVSGLEEGYLSDEEGGNNHNNQHPAKWSNASKPSSDKNETNGSFTNGTVGQNNNCKSALHASNHEEEDWEHEINGNTADIGPELVIALRPVSFEHMISSDAILSPFLSSLSSMPVKVKELKELEVETKAEISIVESNDMKIKNKRPLEDFLSVKVENPGKMNTSNEKAFSRLEDIERPCKAPRIENIQLLKKHGNTGQNILENSVAPMSVEKSEASDSHEKKIKQ